MHFSNTWQYEIILLCHHEHYVPDRKLAFGAAVLKQTHAVQKCSKCLTHSAHIW